MNAYEKRYNNFVKKIINKGFPELKKKRVIVIEVPRFFLFLSFSQKGFGKYYIFINKSRRDSGKKSLKGQFAHELCHIVRDYSGRSIIGDLLYNFIKYIGTTFDMKFSREIESSVDKDVIKRGFAKELYSQGINWKKSFSKRMLEGLYARGYLKPNEIKSYASKIKKW